MYKLLIVDDEQIEREGMAHFIQWDKYDIQLCGTAWNGADALGKIQKDVPDIVLSRICHAGTVDVWIFTDVVHTDVDINLLFIHQLQPAK